MKNKYIERMAVRALRHCPEALGLNLDSAGYCPVRDLAEALKKRGYDVSVHDIEKLGENERFGFAAEHTLIRADYGSSIGLRLEDMYESGEAPPEYLYHGTSVSAVEPIKELGIIKAPGKNGRRARDHIFLTESEKTAYKKGKRHGDCAVLKISALAMHNAGYRLYHAKNDIWLADFVPPRFIELC